MCGIVGIIAKHGNGFFNKHADIFTWMLQFDSIRGEDSTGLFGVTKGNTVDVLKGDADGYLFTHSKDYQDMEKKIYQKYHIVVGHNRKATAGAITPENAHPFQEGRIVVVHNGVVRNFDKLTKDIKNADEVEVDSHALAHLLAKQDAKGALEQINGAFALVWYDTESRTLSLARNDERPLGLIEYEDIWIISSEFGLPLWLNRREQRKEIKCREVPTDKILTWKLDGLREQPKELGWDEYAAYATPSKDNYYVPTFVDTNHMSSPPMSQYPRTDVAAVLRPSQPMFRRKGNAPLVLVHQDKVENTSFREGMEVTFTFEDDKETEHGGWEVIGSPVFDGSKDSNVIVRWPMPAMEFKRRESELAEYNFFRGRVRAVGQMHGVPVIYMQDVKPVKLLRSFNGSVHNSETIAPILKAGCKRCNQPIIEADVERSIIQQKPGDGSYRVICHECLADSVQAAELNKAQVEKTMKANKDGTLPLQ